MEKKNQTGRHAKQTDKTVEIEITKAEKLDMRVNASFAQLAHLREIIAAQNIPVYQCPIESDNETITKRNINIMTVMPFAIIGSDEDVITPNSNKIWCLLLKKNIMKIIVKHKWKLQKTFDNPKFKEETLRKKFTEQLIVERDRLNKDLESELGGRNHVENYN
ncbi:hypothetical protein Glove_172g55 [Diversispora epigaea]|uniref:Septin-type G domain-containing protein n=1 Tax=Diversispora epigaea TaxID=1348612 RepID=A0A397IS76_9GLOM|nr:hypothetical protein Glove_172g55 [Diversispora epigaea]